MRERALHSCRSRIQMHNQRGALYVGNEYRLMSAFFMLSSGSHMGLCYFPEGKSERTM